MVKENKDTKSCLTDNDFNKLSKIQYSLNTGVHGIFIPQSRYFVYRLRTKTCCRS